MDINQVKQQIKNNIKWECLNKHTPGGQSCSIPQLKMKLISEEIDIIIEIGYYRCGLKNKDLAMKLFELAIEEIVY